MNDLMLGDVVDTNPDCERCRWRYSVICVRNTCRRLTLSTSASTTRISTRSKKTTWMFEVKVCNNANKVKRNSEQRTIQVIAERRAFSMSTLYSYRVIGELASISSCYSGCKKDPTWDSSERRALTEHPESFTDQIKSPTNKEKGTKLTKQHNLLYQKIEQKNDKDETGYMENQR